MALWLFKEEPDTYSFADLQRDGSTIWSGVKNPLAQKHLASIKKGDRIFFYHTGKEKAVVGVMEATADANPDPDDARVNVSGITDILGSGHIDVLTNGFITLEELAGDLRAGSITSTDDDVTLTAPASIVDALDDTDADVSGVNITWMGDVAATTRVRRKKVFSSCAA